MIKKEKKKIKGARIAIILLLSLVLILSLSRSLFAAGDNIKFTINCPTSMIVGGTDNFEFEYAPLTGLLEEGLKASVTISGGGVKFFDDTTTFSDGIGTSGYDFIKQINAISLGTSTITVKILKNNGEIDSKSCTINVKKVKCEEDYTSGAHCFDFGNQMGELSPSQTQDENPVQVTNPKDNKAYSCYKSWTGNELCSHYNYCCKLVSEGGNEQTCENLDETTKKSNNIAEAETPNNNQCGTGYSLKKINTIQCCTKPGGPEKKGKTEGTKPSWTGFFSWMLPVNPPTNPKNVVDFFKGFAHGGPGAFAASILSLGQGLWEAGVLEHGAGSCSAEEHLHGVEFCHLCNNYTFLPCTEERCNALGDCRAVQLENEQGYLCLEGECTKGLPQIKNIKADWLIDNTHVWNGSSSQDCSGTSCTLTPSTAVPYNVNSLNLTIMLDQGARCNYDFEPGLNYSDMKYSFDNIERYPQVQSALISLTQLALGRDHTIYIKCQGECGQAFDYDSYNVKFKFEKEPDWLPPRIVAVIPDGHRQYLSNDAKYQQIEIVLNENGPGTSRDGTCQFSTTHPSQNLTVNWSDNGACGDSNPDKMCGISSNGFNKPDDRVLKASYCKNNQPCAYINNVGEVEWYKDKNECAHCYLNISLDSEYATIVNWTKLSEQMQQQYDQNDNVKAKLDAWGLSSHIGELTGISKVFEFMFRCQDANHNKMKEEDAYDYSIMTYPPYNMTIVEPTPNLETYDREIPINVTTTRGTMCKYNATTRGMPRWENMMYIEGTEALDVEHIGKTSWLEPGSYTLWVKCRDAGGLEVTNKTTFTILRDIIPPIIIRMFGSGNDLSVETNEWAKCVYNVDDQKKCNYEFKDGQDTTSVDGYHHLTSLVKDWTYYIKCKDRFNNTASAGSCTAIVKPYELPGY